jgi:hypothetical protein
MNNIDDYANSMFVFEELNPIWVKRCALYLLTRQINSYINATHDLSLRSVRPDA